MFQTTNQKRDFFEECCGLFLDAHSDSVSNEGIYLGDFRHETMVFTSKYRGVRSPVDFPQTNSIQF